MNTEVNVFKGRRWKIETSVTNVIRKVISSSGLIVFTLKVQEYQNIGFVLKKKWSRGSVVPKHRFRVDEEMK